jgi:hypothetical protein
MLCTDSRRAITISAGCVLAIALASAATSHAASIIYTFDAPPFTPPPKTTPFLNVAPNVGDPAFETDFTSSPTTNGFGTVGLPPNSLFSGTALFDVFGPVDILSLAFSSPVFSLVVDFVVNVPQGSLGGIAVLTTVGSASQTSANIGGPFPGGTLAFDSQVAFSTAQLTGFGGSGSGALFAIDNLRLSTTPVPEPGSLVCLGTGFALASLRAYRRRGRLRVRF